MNIINRCDGQKIRHKYHVAMLRQLLDCLILRSLRRIGLGTQYPVENIEEFILLPTVENNSYITVNEENFPCISLRKNMSIPIDRQAGYLICKKVLVTKLQS